MQLTFFSVVRIFTTTQYLHFLTICSSKKAKAEKKKAEINAELKRTILFFLSETGRLCDEENQERNTADRRLDFISKCTSTSADAFIPLCFFCQWELNYGGVLKCFVIAIWEQYIRASTHQEYIYFFPLPQVFICAHIDILMDSSNPSSAIISPWFGSFAHLCSGHVLLRQTDTEDRL